MIVSANVLTSSPAQAGSRESTQLPGLACHCSSCAASGQPGASQAPRLGLRCHRRSPQVPAWPPAPLPCTRGFRCQMDAEHGMRLLNAARPSQALGNCETACMSTRTPDLAQHKGQGGLRSGGDRRGHGRHVPGALSARPLGTSALQRGGSRPEAGCCCDPGRYHLWSGGHAQLPHLRSQVTCVVLGSVLEVCISA